MFVEVAHDHCKTVLAALKHSFSQTIYDELHLVAESGHKICTSLSFISIFSKLISSITTSNQEDHPQLIFVPLKVTTIRNLMIFLSEGKVISNDLECLKDVLDAAKIFGIGSQGWSIDIEEGEGIGSEEIEKSIVEPLAKHEFSILKWEDCQIEAHNGKSVENTELGTFRIDRQEAKSQGEVHKSSKDLNNIVGHRKGGRPKKIVNVKRGRPRKSVSGKRGRPRKSVNDQILCSECPQKFSSSAQLQVHYGRCHTGGKGFKCEKCEKRFKSKRGYEHHVHSFHEEPVVVEESCGVCGEIIVGFGKTEYSRRVRADRKMKKHMRIHGDTKEIWPCCICSNKFSHQNWLDEHMVKAHTNTDNMRQPIQCSKQGCGKKYLTEQSRLFHEKTHDPENFKFLCNLCDLTFINQSGLLLHQEMHNPWRKCGNCGEILQSKQLYNVHVQRCRNDYRFPCTTCGKKFVVKCKLERHLVVHTGAKPYSCENCGKTFSWRGTMRRHVNSEICKKGIKFKEEKMAE